MAVNAATAIGEPSKYCSICGAALVICAGSKIMARVKTIGNPIIYRSASEVLIPRMTFNPFNMIVTVMRANTPPITGSGMAVKNAESLEKKPSRINQPPAATNT